jgi:hypothetical protein
MRDAGKGESTGTSLGADPGEARIGRAGRVQQPSRRLREKARQKAVHRNEAQPPNARGTGGILLAVPMLPAISRSATQEGVY